MMVNRITLGLRSSTAEVMTVLEKNNTTFRVRRPSMYTGNTVMQGQSVNSTEREGGACEYELSAFDQKSKV